ncbi:C4-dicarboxylate TRAP transporter large permease protein DctM [bioreactor metagenome]|uniref:C4-dicarboxylate TRAP transporter large permease protein DctM n=1 Tax=bioreactor metagenome TaxID=1076179 RepID=A0A645HAU3_9ZZZZ
MLIVPLLLPVANYYGVDLLHLGLLTVCNLAVGLITPPFGGNLFVSASVSRVPVNKMYRCIIPFIIAGFTVTLVVTYFPAMTVGLLALLKG